MSQHSPLAPVSKEKIEEISFALQLTSQFLAQLDPVAHFAHHRLSNLAAQCPSTSRKGFRPEQTAPLPVLTAPQALEATSESPHQDPAPTKKLPKQADQKISSSQCAQSETVEGAFKPKAPPSKNTGGRQHGRHSPPAFGDLIKWMQRNFPDVPLRKSVHPTSPTSAETAAVWIVAENRQTAPPQESESQAFLQKVLKGLVQKGIATQLIDWHQLENAGKGSVQLILIDAKQENRLRTHLKDQKLPVKILPIDWEAHANSFELKRALWDKIKQCVLGGA